MLNDSTSSAKERSTRKNKDAPTESKVEQQQPEGSEEETESHAERKKAETRE